MATATTFAVIRDQMVTKIMAITPNVAAEKKFDLVPKTFRLRLWAIGAGSASLRRFEIVRSDAEEPPIVDPSVIERRESVIVTVAYPTLIGIYGTDDLEDVRDVIRRDARDIRDAVFSPNNYVSGQNLADPQALPPVDETEDRVWFQRIPFQLRYYEAQSL